MERRGKACTSGDAIGGAESLGTASVVWELAEAAQAASAPPTSSKPD